MKIKEVEVEFAQKLGSQLKSILRDLSYYLPEHYQVHVSMFSNGRKKKSNAAANNWSPESGQIEIRFEPAPQQDKQLEISPAKAQSHGLPASVSGTGSYTQPPVAELLRALD